MENPGKVILAFIGVFVAGAVFGGVFTLGVGKRFANEVKPRTAVAPRTVTKEPGTPVAEMPQRKKAKDAIDGTNTQVPASRIQPAIMKQLTQRLGVTQEQRKAILPIVARAADDITRMGREHIADTARVMDRMNEDISALLSPEQRQKLEAMKQERLERVRKERQKLGGVPEKELEGANRNGVTRPAVTTPGSNNP